MSYRLGFGGFFAGAGALAAPFFGGVLSMRRKTSSSAGGEAGFVIPISITDEMREAGASVLRRADHLGALPSETEYEVAESVFMAMLAAFESCSDEMQVVHHGPRTISQRSPSTE